MEATTRHLIPKCRKNKRERRKKMWEGKKNLIKKIGLKERRPRMPHTYITYKNQAPKKKTKVSQKKNHKL
jgi:hypothetical protein